MNTNWVGIVLFAAAFAALRVLKWNPILVMVLCGVGNLLVGSLCDPFAPKAKSGILGLI